MCASLLWMLQQASSALSRLLSDTASACVLHKSHKCSALSSVRMEIIPVCPQQKCCGLCCALNWKDYIQAGQHTSLCAGGLDRTAREGSFNLSGCDGHWGWKGCITLCDPECKTKKNARRRRAGLSHFSHGNGLFLGDGGKIICDSEISTKMSVQINYCVLMAKAGIWLPL